ncbi:hypothetical protein [Tessaracoccus sp.]
MADWYLTESTYELYKRVQHWYGEIGQDGQHLGEGVRLVRVLDEAAAKALSAEDDWKWEVGDETERFDSRDDLRAAARLHFQSNAAPGARLYLGRDLGQVRDVLEGLARLKVKPRTFLAHRSRALSLGQADDPYSAT